MLHLQWADEFENPMPMVTFGHDFIALLESQAATGTIITAEEHWSSFTFKRGNRVVAFTRRGKLGYQRLECWEVRLADRNAGVQLGSVLGIRDYACVVTSGFANIQTITKMWLDGADLASLINAVPLWDKINTQEELKFPADN